MRNCSLSRGLVTDKGIRDYISRVWLNTHHPQSHISRLLLHDVETAYSVLTGTTDKQISFCSRTFALYQYIKPLAHFNTKLYEYKFNYLTKKKKTVTVVW